jgi:sulfite reductase beta subunit-like hemoprotein
MQRVRAPGGVLTADQWRTLARATADFTPRTPLHLTTRQDVEFHDLAAEAIPPLQARLADAGLSTVGACGDTLRNVTVCPCSGALAGSADLLPLARAVQATLTAEAGADALPRKFKVTLSCGPACGQPWINDLGFIVRGEPGAWKLSAIGAGSLGARPHTGILLAESIKPHDVLPMAVAALRIFAAHGDRRNRHKARLRHVREQVGNAALLAMLDEAFRAARSERPWPDVALVPTAGGCIVSRLLTFPDGDVTPAAAEALALLAADDAVRVRVAAYHRVVVFGPNEPALASRLAALPALAEAARPQPAIVACPGSRWCARALVDTRAVAARLREALATSLPPDAVVAVSGCPNGCAHSAVADVGLTGRLVGASDGGRMEAFDMVAGGGMGRDARLGAPAATKVPWNDAPARVAALWEELHHAR